jgi:TolB-like protein
MVRISVQLIDAGTDAHLWSETYDGDMSDLSRIFIIQSEVAQSVARG